VKEFIHVVHDIHGPLRADGDAVSQEEVGILLLLAGDGVDDDHRHLLAQAFGGGDAARFCDDDVGNLHHFV
jgi:hypothetical protein